jgi:hypothetical protein
MPAPPKRTESRMHVRLANPGEAPVQLVLEPWGETHTIPPDDVVELQAQGPDDGALEIAHARDTIVVWGWPGSTIQLFLGGEELGSVRGRPPVPGRSIVLGADEAEPTKNGTGGPRPAARGRSARPAPNRKR